LLRNGSDSLRDETIVSLFKLFFLVLMV